MQQKPMQQTIEAGVQNGELVRECNRFTGFVKSRRSPEYAILQRWLEWFHQRGVPAVIAASAGGYAVYRAGVSRLPEPEYLMHTWGVTRRQAETLLNESDGSDDNENAIREQLRQMIAADAFVGDHPMTTPDAQINPASRCAPV